MITYRQYSIMNKTISICSIICLVTLLVVLSITAPWMLGDANCFLAGFVNHELLAFLGVIVTVTLASAANLHLTLNKLEHEVQARVFQKTRQKIKQSASWLLSFLLIALILVIVKPVAACSSEVVQSLFNSGAILIVFCSILILIDITLAILKIEPRIDEQQP